MNKRNNIVKNKAKSAPRKKNVEKYDVFTTITGKQIAITKGNVIINVAIDQDHIEISSKNGFEFIFKSANKAQTLKRWEEVISCLSLAVQEAKKERKLS